MDTSDGNYQPCGNLFYQLVLHYDGNLSACCIDLTSTLNLGKIGEDKGFKKIDKILDYGKLNKLRRDMLLGNLEDLGVCKNCDFKKPDAVNSNKIVLLTFLNAKICKSN